MKHCSSCNKDKPLSDFSNNKARKDNKQAHCKQCRNKYLKSWYKRNKKLQVTRAAASRKKVIEYVKELKSKTPCKDCNKFYHWCQLDFDHLHNKLFNVSTGARTLGLVKVKQEIEKCDIVCANCHRLRTHNSSIA